MLPTGLSTEDNMTNFFSFILIFIVTFTVACSKNNPNIGATEIINYENATGWLHKNCLAIKNKNIPNGALVTIVLLDKPQNISQATVQSKTTDSKKCLPLLEDRRKINISSGYSFYLINSELDINLGIALIGEIKNIKKYAFDYCTTTEGILYSLKKIDQSDDKLWSGYYYLGYESKATCND